MRLPGLTLAHLGSLHAYEHVLVWLLAFGPFLVLFVVIYLVRRRDLAEEEGEAEDAEQLLSPTDERAS